jgi:hypothetical protein
MTTAGRRDYLAKSYGLRADDVAGLLSQQQGVCLICLRRPAVHVDHDHETGEVRGMLCFRCNTALGQFDDDARRLQRAADYVQGRRLVIQQVAPGVFHPSYADRRRELIDVAALRQKALRG